MSRIPGLAETMPPAYAPTKAGPYKREAPLLRQVFGLTLAMEKNPAEKELERLGFKPQQIFTSTGDPHFDNLIK